jgi:HD-GYP domain-containing protein (c-di-GMP phosphodiesterase class II)
MNPSIPSGITPAWTGAAIPAAPMPGPREPGAAAALPGRAASAGVASPRSPLFRDAPSAPEPPPLAAALDACMALRETAMQGVLALFGAAVDGRPVPLSVAEDTVSDLMAAADREPDALVSLLRLKQHGDYAHMHSVAVCALMACLARHLGLDARQRRQAALAGLLHDIGKAFIPARMLAKPGRLTDEEFAAVRAHPQRGFEVLAATEGVADAVKDVAQHHHERPDGRGYPHRLSGGGIALPSRMGAVCDVYDAITSNRPYKDGWDPGAALQAMARWTAEGQFDAKVCAAFEAMMGRYPIGSLVRLRSRRLGVVCATARDRHEPAQVMAFHCLQSQRTITPELVRIGSGPGADAIEALEPNDKWRFRDLDKLWAGDIVERLHARSGDAF